MAARTPCIWISSSRADTIGGAKASASATSPASEARTATIRSPVSLAAAPTRRTPWAAPSVYSPHSTIPAAVSAIRSFSPPTAPLAASNWARVAVTRCSSAAVVVDTIPPLRLYSAASAFSAACSATVVCTCRAFAALT